MLWVVHGQLAGPRRGIVRLCPDCGKWRLKLRAHRCGNCRRAARRRAKMRGKNRLRIEHDDRRLDNQAREWLEKRGLTARFTA
jgi:hypothetical protein